jgi:hypothetical protein
VPRVKTKHFAQNDAPFGLSGSAEPPSGLEVRATCTEAWKRSHQCGIAEDMGERR